MKKIRYIICIMQIDSRRNIANVEIKYYVHTPACKKKKLIKNLQKFVF